MTEVVAVEELKSDLAPLHVPPASIIVCIPALNEGRVIGTVVKEAKRYADHVLVCDDGSTDHTFEEGSSSGAMVIRHPRTMGKGAALRTLFREAAKFSPDIIVTLDGDGQHDPADIPRVVAPIVEQKADVVIGSRFNRGNDIPFYRVVGNSILNILTNITARTGIRDTQSGFRAYSSKTAAKIMIAENGMGVDSEILLEVSRTGGRIAERSVRVSYEGDTSTFDPFNHTIQVLSALVRSEAKHHRLPTKKLVWTVLLGLPLLTAFLVGNLTGEIADLENTATALVGAAGFIGTFGLCLKTAQKPGSKALAAGHGAENSCTS